MKSFLRIRATGILFVALFPVVAACAPHTVQSPEDSGPFSLRQAIENAQPGDTIVFHPILEGIPILLQEELLVDKDLTIDGSAVSGGVTLDGQGRTRIMKADGPRSGLDVMPVTVRLNKLKFINGFVGNGKEVSGSGGAIDGDDVNLTITNCAFERNRAEHHGGALSLSFTATVTVENSSFIANRADQNGGAIYSGGGGSYTRVTVVDNQVSGDAAIWCRGTTTFAECTIARNLGFGNSAFGTAGVGGWLSGGDTLTFNSCIVADNFLARQGVDNFYVKSVDSDREVFDSVISGGGNKSDTDEGYLRHPSDLLEIDPALGPLMPIPGCPQEEAILLNGSVVGGAAEMATPLVPEVANDEGGAGLDLRGACGSAGTTAGNTLRIVPPASFDGQTIALGSGAGGQGTPIDCIGSSDKNLILDCSGIELAISGGGLQLSGWNAATVIGLDFLNCPGDAVEASGCRVEFVDCTWNACPGRALVCEAGADVRLQGCEFRDCGSLGDADAHAVVIDASSNCTVNACLFRGCASGGNGSCVENNNQCQAFNSVFADSRCAGRGAIACSATSTKTTLVHCTVYENEGGGPAGEGGGVYHEGPGILRIIRNILWANRNPNEAAATSEELQDSQVASDGAGTVEVTESNVEFGHAGEGNIASAPEFMDPDPADPWQEFTPVATNTSGSLTNSILGEDFSSERRHDMDPFGALTLFDAIRQARGGDGNGDGCDDVEVGALEMRNLRNLELAADELRILLGSDRQSPVGKKLSLRYAIVAPDFDTEFSLSVAVVQGEGELKFDPKGSGLSDFSGGLDPKLVNFLDLDEITANGINKEAYCITYCPPPGWEGEAQIRIAARIDEPGAPIFEEVQTITVEDTSPVAKVTAVTDGDWTAALTFNPDVIPDNDPASDQFFRVDLDAHKVTLDVDATVHQVLSGAPGAEVVVDPGRTFALDSFLGAGHGPAGTEGVDLNLGAGAQVSMSGTGGSIRDAVIFFGQDSVIRGATGNETVEVRDVTGNGNSAKLGADSSVLKQDGQLRVDLLDATRTLTMDGSDAIASQINGTVTVNLGRLLLADTVIDFGLGGELLADGPGARVSVAADATLTTARLIALDDGTIDIAGLLEGGWLDGTDGDVSLNDGATLDGGVRPMVIAGDLACPATATVSFTGQIEKAAGATPASMLSSGSVQIDLLGPTILDGVDVDVATLQVRSSDASPTPLTLNSVVEVSQGSNLVENIDLTIGPEGRIEIKGGSFSPTGGSLTVDGLLSLDGGNAATTFFVPDTVTVDGDGLIETGTGNGNDIRGDDATDRLILNVDALFRRVDLVGLLVDLNGHTLVEGFTLFDPSNAAPSRVAGVLEVRDGGQLLLRDGPVDFTGGQLCVQPGGEAELGSGAMPLALVLVNKPGGLTHVAGAVTARDPVVTGELIIDEGSGLTVEGSLSLQDGSVVLDATNNTTAIAFDDGGDPEGAEILNSGGGEATIVVRGARTSLTVQDSDMTLTVGEDVEVRMEDGNLMNNRGKLINRGKIYATKAGSNVLFRANTNLTQRNENRLGAKGGIFEAFAITLENASSGVLEALKGGVVKLQFSSVQGGKILSDKDSKVVLDNTNFAGTEEETAEIGGIIESVGNSTVGPHVRGTIGGVAFTTPDVASASIQVNNIGGIATYAPTRDNHLVQNPNPAVTWSLQSGQKIIGGGTYKRLGMSNGTVESGEDRTITIQQPAPGISHQIGGTGISFTRKPGSKTRFEGGLQSQGVIGVRNGGTTEVIGGTSLLGGSRTTVNGGSFITNTLQSAANSTLKVTGNIIAAGGASIGGFLAGGNSPGAASFSGALTLEPTAELEVELAGSGGVPGVDYDYLHGGSDLVLGGTLKPRLFNGFVPGPDETFVVIECDGELTGAFAAIDQPFPNLGTFQVDIDENNDRVTLSFEVTGEVRFADFQRLWFTDEQIAKGDADEGADFDADGTGTFLEWIYGRVPTVSDAYLGGLAVLDPSDGGLHPSGGGLELVYPRDSNLPDDLAIVVQSSIDAAAWPELPESDYDEIPGVPIDGRPGVELVTIRITNAELLEDAKLLFIRLGFEEL